MYTNIFQAVRLDKPANQENSQNTKGWCQGIIDNMNHNVSPHVQKEFQPAVLQQSD